MADFKWGYVLNQNAIRRDRQERAFKQISVCGFRGIEMRQGSTRFQPLSRPDLIEVNFGNARNFVAFTRSCGIDQVVSFFYDPGLPSYEESSPGRSATNPAEHDAILESIRPFAQFLRDTGGSRLVVKPMASYFREAPVTDEKIKKAADCWNKVGNMTQRLGVRTTMHIDCMCAIHSLADISKLLQYTEPNVVGLTIDTGESTVAGIDPVVLYEQHYNRVDHFHFKDAHVVDSLEEYKTPAGANLLNDGGQRNVVRWFYEMGRPGGLVKFPALMESLTKHNYQGWIMVENEQSPNPAESCMLNSWYMRFVVANRQSAHLAAGVP